MRRSIIILIIAALLVVLLVACGHGQQHVSTYVPEETTTTVESAEDACWDRVFDDITVKLLPDLRYTYGTATPEYRDIAGEWTYAQGQLNRWGYDRALYEETARIRTYCRTGSFPPRDGKIHEG